MRLQTKLYKCHAKYALLGAVAALAMLACAKKSDNASQQGETAIIQNQGSDTMLNLAQAWAEAYHAVAPGVSVEVSGGGSGTGIAALINGTVDIANCSRKMHEEEIKRAQENTGQVPVEFLVGYDALAVYVNKDNPLDEISLEQLGGIFGEGGTTTTWSQLGVSVPGCAKEEIIRVSRQSNSGTYEYFRESILGKTGDFKLGSRDMNGSKDVVDLVEHTPCAIGYSGLGYNTPNVKMLRIARHTGDTAYPPSVETALNHTYPIARPLLMYSSGKPTEVIQNYLNWVRSDAGQKILEEVGYVPLPATERIASATGGKE